MRVSGPHGAAILLVLLATLGGGIPSGRDGHHPSSLSSFALPAPSSEKGGHPFLLRRDPPQRPGNALTDPTDDRSAPVSGGQPQGAKAQQPVSNKQPTAAKESGPGVKKKLAPGKGEEAVTFRTYDGGPSLRSLDPVLNPLPARPRGGGDRCYVGRYSGPNAGPRRPRVGLASCVDLSPAAWKQARTSEWFRSYWFARRSAFGEVKHGFIALFNREFRRDETMLCGLGEGDYCHFEPCDQGVLAQAVECDRESAGQILRSIENLRRWYLTYINALTAAMNDAQAISKQYVMIFYKDPQAQDFDSFRLAMTFTNAVVGLIGPTGPSIRRLIPFTNNWADTFFFLPPHLFANFQVWIMSSVKSPPATIEQTEAGLGANLGKALIVVRDKLQEAYTTLLQGGTVSDTTLVDWIGSGNFLNGNTWDVKRLTTVMRTLVRSAMINMLWGTLRVYIIGGGPCDRDVGTGTVPKEGATCVNGKMWVLYHWDHDKKAFNWPLDEANGWVTSAPGALRLNTPALTGFTWQDAVISSVRTAQEARSGGLNGIYNRFVQTLADEKLDLAGLARAAARAAGSWSIPVCDISHLGPNNVVPHMNEIYRPFSKNDRPKYCSRTLCSNNEAVTKAFFEQAHLWDFEPPFRHCRDNARLPPKPGWSLSLNNPSLKVDEGKKPEVKEQAST